MNNRTIYYALSIFLKNGDVLHLNGLSREEKDRYFTLARNPQMSLLIEEENEIRNLLGSDIASITYKKYTEAYEKTVFQLEKMFMSESTFGTGIYYLLIKLFVAVSFIVAVKETATGALKGDLMAIILDADQIGKLFTDSFSAAKPFFHYTYIFMIAIALVDLILGLIAKYHINQDGAPEVRTRRFSGIAITIVFIIVVSLIFSVVLKI